MIKPRLLWCSEASYLSTGYSIYSREILSRLHDSGLFDIYEFGSYGSNEDPRAESVKWKFIGNLPQRGNKNEEDNYGSHPVNQFGQWKFEHVVNMVKPHIVYDNRDIWMCQYQLESPYRPYYHLSWLLAVDAEKQPTSTKNIIPRLDSITSYTDWGVNLINSESNGLAKTFNSCPGGAPKEFVPEDKLALKEQFGLEKMKIVGTVMRNQRRKLFPDLFESFRKYLDSSKRNDVLLYLHTSFPDKNPWMIDELINEYGLSNKVLMTYRCSTSEPNKGCGLTFPAFFSDYGVICKRCKQTATCASVQNGVDNEFFNKIYNLFDVYIQYANSESLGIPQLEAAACGTPVMSVDYSAMSDVVRKLNGTPIKVKTLYRELETTCMRAVPDNDDLVKQLTKFFSLPQSLRNRAGMLARQGYDEHYGYDKAAQTYINHWSTLDFNKLEANWKSPPRIYPIAEQIDHSKLSNSEYSKFLIANVFGEPNRIGSYMHTRLLKDLNYGCTIGIGGGFDLNEFAMLDHGSSRQFNRDQAYQEMRNQAEKRNFFEKMRTNG